MKGGRSFAQMDPAEHRRIAAMGGRATHRKGKAPELTAERAKELGRRGGLTRAARARAAKELR